MAEARPKTSDWANVCEKIINHLNSHGAIAQKVTSLKDSQADFLVSVSGSGAVETRTKTENKEFQFRGDIKTNVSHRGGLLLEDNYSGIGGWNPVSEKMAIDVLGIHVFKRFIKSLNKELEG